jgi:predicted nuclease with TOPRIM domain
MSNMQPIDPIDECVRLGRELARLQKEYKDTLDEAVAVETERNALKRENAALRAEVAVTRQNWKAYQFENAALRAWIKEEGSRNDVCTYEILKEVCDDCKCGKRKGAQP